MIEHEFHLYYNVGVNDLDKILDDIACAGLTDTILGMGIEGILAIGFIRQARTCEEAIDIAIKELNNVLPSDITLIKVCATV